MTKILWTILKWTLFVAVLVAIGLGTYFYLCPRLGWPWWISLVIPGSIVAVLGLILFVRKLVFRRREEGFVRQVIEQETAAGTPMFEARQLQDLENRFREAVDRLKKSRLKKRGNPLYALPWYLMIGEQSSGKTTALKNSRLPSCFPDLGHPPGDSATTNLDWWFFDDSVVLDTAGRYAMGTAHGKNKEEWKKFLSLLSRYRKKEPINGVVVAVPADKLRSARKEDVEQYGRGVNQSIDHVMRVLGAKFPVYVLVTKLDQVPGMNSFCGAFPWRAFKEGMGNVNRNVKRDTQTFIDETFASITERLKDLKLVILHENENADPAMLLFPEEFERLKPGLEAFIKGAFQENPYQEPAMLRGIFFSSAQQAGQPKSDMLVPLGVNREMHENLPGSNRGFFLQDFFSKILPDDRYMYSPLREYMNWKRSTRYLGAAAVMGVALVAVALTFFSFVKNYNALDSYTEKFEKPPEMVRDATRDIILLDSFRSQIMELEGLNANWWLPRMGLYQSREVEKGLKERYVNLFKEGRPLVDKGAKDRLEGLLERIDDEMGSRIAALDETTPNEVVGDYAEHLVKRINLIEAYLDGVPIEKQKEMPQPSTAVVLIIDSTLLPTVASNFNSLYLYYLNWSVDGEEIKREKKKLEGMLIKLVKLKGKSMPWLIAWANREEGLEPVTLAQFWYDRIDDSEETGIMVPPAYTVKGKERIEGFIGQMKKALAEANARKDGDPLDMEGRIASFQDYYGDEYIASWRRFAEDFVKEEYKMRDKEDDVKRARRQWQDLSVAMTTFVNPYFEFTDKMADELGHLENKKDAPAWVKLVVDFQPMKQQVIREGFLEKGMSFAQKFEKAAEGAFKGDPGQARDEVQRHVKAMESLQAYQKALQDISPALESKEKAYQMASGLFKSDDPGKAKSPFNDGFMAVKQFKSYKGSKRGDDQVFWDLMEGPVRNLLYYTCMDAACALQSSWEESVLAELEGVPRATLQNEMFGESGIVWKFAQGPASPFISKNPRGYYARQAYGEQIPFSSEFKSFLTAGSVGRHMLLDEYEVGIEGLPTDVNAGAMTKPEAVVVEMICSEGVQRIENLNYPVKQSFKWNPELCGGVKMDIRFRDFTLTKTYPHYSGFPKFLMDFRNGDKIFTQQDFPLHKMEMDNLGVNFIQVKFELKGHEPLIDLIEKTPLAAPRKIVYCWN